MNKNLIGLLGLALLVQGCLKTTAELRNDPNRNQPAAATSSSSAAPTPPPIVTKQQQAAVEAMRSDDINRDFRELNGRVEVVEKQLNDVKDNEKVRMLEAKITQLEAKIGLLESTVTELHTRSKKEAAYTPPVSAPKEIFPQEPSVYTEANKLYDKQKWEDAVLAFEEYRKSNPKGKLYADATYKIGICFQNLGMKDDAKAFFKEVVDKYPKSKEAGLAKGKLKKL